MTVRIGVGAHQEGRWGGDIAGQARRAEDAGFDSLWLGDHIISPRRIDSTYPYDPSGVVPWAPELEMFDAIVSATVAVTATTEITIGFGTLVLPLRHPIVLAKQLATLDRFSGGRTVLGAGAGWSREEFAALQVDFDDRFEISAEWIGLLRACWTGHPGISHGAHYDLALDCACFPTPVAGIPILVGGSSSAALGLVATVADGWYPLLSPDQLTPDWLGPRWDRVRKRAATAGRDPAQLRLVVYAAADLDVVCALLPELETLGVQEIVIGIDWDDPTAPGAAVAQLRGAGH